MSDPTLSDIDFKNKMAWAWTTLKPFHLNMVSVSFSYGVSEGVFQNLFLIIINLKLSHGPSNDSMWLTAVEL